MKERQKQQLRHKALKKGLDPEALTGKYPVSTRYPRNYITIVVEFLFTALMGLLLRDRLYFRFQSNTVFIHILAQNPSRFQIREAS